MSGNAIMKIGSVIPAIETGASFYWAPKKMVKTMRNIMDEHCLISQASHFTHTAVLQLAMYDNPIFLYNVEKEFEK